MITLAAAALALNVGYNIPAYMPWTPEYNFNSPDQFRNVLLSATVSSSNLYAKYAFISGNDSHEGIYVDGEWQRDNSETKNKSLLMAGVRGSWHNITGFFGGGYLDHPDNIRLAGHWQFNLGIQYEIDRFSVGLEHYSNGRQLLGSKAPNVGIDFITVGYTF